MGAPEGARRRSTWCTCGATRPDAALACLEQDLHEHVGQIRLVEGHTAALDRGVLFRAIRAAGLRCLVDGFLVHRLVPERDGAMHPLGDCA